VGTEIILDTLFWQQQRDSIEMSWKVKIDNAKLEKGISLYDAMLEINQVKIDDILYNDSLTCRFYLHPNLGERGLNCYLSTKYLEDGAHLIELERKVFRIRQGDTTEQELKYQIPFFVFKDAKK